MEKEEKRKKQNKSLFKEVLIGIGVAGVLILTIRAIMSRIRKLNELQNMLDAYERDVKDYIETPKKKEEYKPDFNEEAVIRKSNKLLRKLWKRGNPDNTLYFDDEFYFDIKDCPFPPYISH